MTKYPAGTGDWACGVKGSGATWRNCTLDPRLADDQWHFMAYRYYGHGIEVDGSSGGSGVNGKRLNIVTGTAGSGAISQTDTENCCGEVMQTGAGLTFGALGIATGRIAMAGRWMRVITDAEIEEIYDTTLAGGGYPF